jgi:replicative DNA helicase
MDNQFESDNSIEIVESKLISELLNNPETLDETILKLDPRDFSNKGLASVFGSIVELNRNSKSVDEHTVIEYLNSHKENQFDDYRSVIRTLASRFVNPVDVTDHIDLIKKASIARQLHEFAPEIQNLKISPMDFEAKKYELEKKFVEI